MGLCEGLRRAGTCGSRFKAFGNESEPNKHINMSRQLGKDHLFRWVVSVSSHPDVFSI